MRVSLPLVVAGTILGLAGAGTSAAATVSSASYSISGVTDTSGNPENATITFVLDDTANVYTLGMTVTNNDTLAQIGADPTSITGFRITMPGTVSGALHLSSGTGNLVNLSSNGSVTEFSGGGAYNAAHTDSLLTQSPLTRLWSHCRR